MTFYTLGNAILVKTCILLTSLPSSISDLLSRVPVPARSVGRRVKAKGFFKGAVVSRGKNWNWDDQDGM